MAALSEATDHEQKTRIVEKLGCKQTYNYYTCLMRDEKEGRKKHGRFTLH